MKFQAALLLVAAACASAFTPARPARALAPVRARVPALEASKFELEAHKALPAIAALTAAYPAHAEGMSAAFMPPILVPIVGIVFPGLSMALFFIYSQKDQ